MCLAELRPLFIIKPLSETQPLLQPLSQHRAGHVESSQRLEAGIWPKTALHSTGWFRSGACSVRVLLAWFSEEEANSTVKAEDTRWYLAPLLLLSPPLQPCRLVQQLAWPLSCLILPVMHFRRRAAVICHSEASHVGNF